MTSAGIIKNCQVTVIVTMLHGINLSVSELNKNIVLSWKIRTKEPNKDFTINYRIEFGTKNRQIDQSNRRESQSWPAHVYSLDRWQRWPCRAVDKRWRFH